MSHYWGFVEKSLHPGKSTWNLKIRFQSSVHHPPPIFWLQFCREFSRVYKLFIGNIPHPLFLGIKFLSKMALVCLGFYLGLFHPPPPGETRAPQSSEVVGSLAGKGRMVSSEILRKTGEVWGFLKKISPNLERFRSYVSSWYVGMRIFLLDLIGEDVCFSLLVGRWFTLKMQQVKRLNPPLLSLNAKWKSSVHAVTFPSPTWMKTIPSMKLTAFRPWKLGAPLEVWRFLLGFHHFLGLLSCFREGIFSPKILKPFIRVLDV